MQKNGTPAIASKAIAALFFIAVFLYLWLRINPALYGMEQDTAFQSTWRFLSDFLSYPGGVADYISAWLSVYFVHPAAGAFIITLGLFLIYYATLRVLRLLFGNGVWRTAGLFPVVFCISLHSNYYHRFSITIALGVALLSFVLYGSWNSRHGIYVNALFYLLLAILLYYCAGGAMLIFALLCTVYEIIIRRRWGMGLAFGAIAAVVPLLSGEYLFLVSLRDAYLILLPFGGAGYRMPVMTYALYAFYPALFFALPLAGFGRAGRRPRLFGGRTGKIGAGVLLTALIGAVTIFSFNPVDNISLRMCKMSREAKWTGVLDEFQKSWIDNVVTNSVIGEALYNINLLPVGLFSFPQNFGARGIFLYDNETSNSWDQDAFLFFYRGEIYFKLGLVNEAQQWMYEALSVRGETPRALKRLAQIHALKGELEAAGTCLSILESMPGHGKWARQFRDRLEKGTFCDADPQLQAIRASMPTSDFIRSSLAQPVLDLEKALRQHPVNRMTFEYAMASYLLMGNLPKIASLMEYFNRFGYTEVPALYQQALIVLAMANYPGLPPMTAISQRTADDFKQFNGTLQRYGNNFKAAEKELLGKYWNSYWYYLFYVLPAPGGNN